MDGHSRGLAENQARTQPAAGGGGGRWFAGGRSHTVRATRASAPEGRSASGLF